MFTEDMLRTAEQLLAEARAKRLKIATAESCTGGLVAAALTEIAGSSDVFERGFVTYSNEAKHALLCVPEEIIRVHGAVSPDTARYMAQGVLANTPADLAVSVTGIAGPGGGSEAKPVGLVYFAALRRHGMLIEEVCRFGPLTRGVIRIKAVETALALLARLL